MSVENPNNAGEGESKLPEANGENPFTLEDLELISNNSPKAPVVVESIGDHSSDDGDKLG